MYIIYIICIYIYTYCIIQRYYTQFKFWLPLMTYQKGVGCQHSQLVVDSCADLITFRNLYLACHTPFWICLVMIPFFWACPGYHPPIWWDFQDHTYHTSLILPCFLGHFYAFLVDIACVALKKGPGSCRRIFVCPEGSNMEPRSRGWS